jgi:hypothetical protein
MRVILVGEIIGADHWSLTLDGWLLLAINAQLVGSGLAAEESQWSWLERQLGERRPSQPVALVSHKPMAAADAELAAAPPYRFLPRPGRVRPQLVEPDGIAQLTVARDLPDPYHR